MCGRILNVFGQLAHYQKRFVQQFRHPIYYSILNRFSAKSHAYTIGRKSDIVRRINNGSTEPLFSAALIYGSVEPFRLRSALTTIATVVTRFARSPTSERSPRQRTDT